MSELKELLQLLDADGLRRLVSLVALSHPETVARDLESVLAQPYPGQKTCYLYEGGMTVHAPGCSCYTWPRA